MQPQKRINQTHVNVDIATAPESKKRSWKNVWRASAVLLAVAILLAVTIPLASKANNDEHIQEGDSR